MKKIPVVLQLMVLTVGMTWIWVPPSAGMIQISPMGPFGVGSK